ncbi:MAG TPA: peptidylprolyl isomerase [Thermoanaerobaculia bacterium]|nr:peptidylprolyl isomerase [Thermoanaerobaculia bacterium]
MNRFLISTLALAALPLLGQQPAPAPQPAASAASQKIVAVVNGETITLEKLNQLYDRLGTQMREQYERTGGKAGFLDNYIRKRLVVQEAIKSGFDKRPEIQAEMDAAKEGALFDRYVRDVVSAPIVTDAEIHAYYDQHQSEFATPEMIKVRHIVITANGAGPAPKTKEQALEAIKGVYTAIRSQNVFPKGTDQDAIDRIVLAHFAQAAQKYSEDGSAQSGGDLGWVSRGSLDTTFEETAFALKKGSMSGIVETRFGFHLILVEDKKPAGTESFETAKSKVREYLMTQHASDVMAAAAKLMNDLRNSSKVSVNLENLR